MFYVQGKAYPVSISHITSEQEKIKNDNDFYKEILTGISNKYNLAQKQAFNILIFANTKSIIDG